MKRSVAVLAPGVLLVAAVVTQRSYGQDEVPIELTFSPSNTVTGVQTQTAIGGGNAEATADGGNSISWSNSQADGGSGIGWSNSKAEGGVGWSDSSSSVNIKTTSTTNVKNRVPPLTTYHPYLPIFQHGGWGTINAYFPTGPSANDMVYQQVFDPSNADDVRAMRGILGSLGFQGPVEMIGGLINGIGTLFGGPDRFHHGRGVEIINAVVRERRPKDKPLFVFIDSYIDPDRLRDAGYAYVGRLSFEGKTNRNWDHVYNAAIAEALPWDVDILLVSGGMKGVTVGSNTSLSSGGGYGQPDFSLSLFGGVSKGVTEGKGEAVLSASAFRYCPELIQRRRSYDALLQKICKQPGPGTVATAAAPSRPAAQPAAAATPAPRQAASPRQAAAPSQAVAAAAAAERPAVVARNTNRTSPGIKVSHELWNKAGFSGPVKYVTLTDSPPGSQ